MIPHVSVRPNINWEHSWEDYDDITRIQKALQTIGYDVTLKQAEEFWSEYSNSMSASWLVLPEDFNRLMLLVYEQTARSDLYLEFGKRPANHDGLPQDHHHKELIEGMLSDLKPTVRYLENQTLIWKTTCGNGDNTIEIYEKDAPYIKYTIPVKNHESSTS